MSGLIKSGAEHKVRAFLNPVRPPAAPAADPRIEALERENADLRAAVAAERTAAGKAAAAARAEGERLGRASAEDSAGRQIETLAKGVGDAVAAWRERLDGLDGLAAALARAALAKLLEEDGGPSRFVAGAIARQMRRLRRDSLVAIRVSALDFADPEALAALGAEAGTGSVRIIADADLKPGECRIDLQLGHIDVGPGTQWAQLAGLLDEMAGQ